MERGVDVRMLLVLFFFQFESAEAKPGDNTMGERREKLENSAAGQALSALGFELEFQMGGDIWVRMDEDGNGMMITRALDDNDEGEAPSELTERSLLGDYVNGDPISLRREILSDIVATLRAA